jgi:hypothetical protein
MKRVIFGIVLAVVSNCVVAEWVQINNKENLTTYIDPKTIEKTGNIVKMWGIVDLKESRKEQEGKSFLSAKGLQEYDCKTEQTRKVSLALFSGNMGAGEVVHTYSDADKWAWTPLTPGSITESMWKTACGKH